MSATNIKPGSAPKGGQGGIAALAPSNQSILLDKLNVRRSTPDSEALASSDDEPDSHRQDTPHAPAQPQRPVRRASWLNDTSQATLPHPRKGSFAGSSMSPTASHPSTPSGEAGAGVWAPHPPSSGAMGRGHQPPSFPWGTAIWTAERKEPPSRLTEVLPSPTSTLPASQSFFNNETSMPQTSPTPREQGTSSQIPFAIPLHPTPKTYRSQSYSVGQLDPEQQHTDAKTIEMLTRENAMLRQQAIWQSSLGFGGLSEIPQSRRHSFADIPTRQPSISSMGEAVSMHETTSPDAPQNQDFAGFTEASGFNTASPGKFWELLVYCTVVELTWVEVSYYSAGSNLPGAQQAIASSAYGNPYQPSYGLAPGYANRPPSPHRSMYGMSQPRHNQLLHIVLFKCSRADVFYIQEGTGLTVKPGDLVIVEADRGTDLGTVAKDNVDWQAAKELKEHYAEEHYKWLVMYSQNAAAQEGTGAGLMAASNGLQGSAIGGMGPPSGHHMQEANSGELKPKMIKRLAQSHEIHGLRDKEGNEAKAKRMCMQKVKEHGLNMEILDAEFQMDWKKLTFYYFADCYINFNSLVTDLFKIYKTRIWMSAINPASFASPTLGLQAPSGVGPGAVGLGRAGGSNNADRRANPPQESQSTFANANPTGRSFQPAFSSPFNATDRPSAGSSAYPPTGFPYSAYGNYSGAPRAPGYMPGMVQAMDAYGAGFSQNGEFPPTMRARFSNPHDATPSHDQAQPSLATQNEWANSFQGLSLNTR
ncbi:PSP1 C-terminal conserved region-domain-containing protein [Nemania serpens]|nr:PSP1 C-terminal conserved region-domain-containing protein [Nemania serpens]